MVGKSYTWFAVFKKDISLRKTYKVILFKDRSPQENHDIILFILIMLYFEVPVAYKYHHFYYKYRELNRKYNRKRDKMASYLRNIKKEMKNNVYTFFNLLNNTYKSQKDIEPTLQLVFNQLFRSIDTVIYIIKTYDICSVGDIWFIINNLWTRNLTDKTGLRQLVLRIIAFLQDLIYHGQYKNYNKTSYELLKYIMPLDNQGNSMLYDLTQEEVYKVIKGITYYTCYKDYFYVFEGYKEYRQSKVKDPIDKYVKLWEKNNLSFPVFNKIYQEYIEKEQSEPDDYIK